MSQERGQAGDLIGGRCWVLLSMRDLAVSWDEYHHRCALGLRECYIVRVTYDSRYTLCPVRYAAHSQNIAGLRLTKEPSFRYMPKECFRSCESRRRQDKLSLDEDMAGGTNVGSVRPFLLEVADHLPGGRCLDIAAGRGGNSLFMARRGYRVDAVDWSVEQLMAARSEVLHRRVQLNLVAADLTTYPFDRERYDVILCFRYLERRIFPAIARALKPAGALVFETFTLAHRRTRPDFPLTYCLEPGELLHAFPELHVALYRELPAQDTASLLAFRRV